MTRKSKQALKAHVMPQIAKRLAQSGYEERLITTGKYAGQRRWFMSDAVRSQFVVEPKTGVATEHLAPPADTLREQQIDKWLEDRLSAVRRVLPTVESRLDALNPDRTP